MPRVKITFLGTGPSGRIPRPGCDRPSCKDARKKGSRSRRLQQSLLMEYGGTTLLFDIPEDVVKEFRHARHVRRLDAAFISHPHNDAYGGLTRVRTILGTLKQELLPVYMEEATFERAREQFGDLNSLEPRIMQLKHFIRTGPLTVQPFRVHHAPDERTHPTAGFIIEAGKRNIVLITDVKTIPPDSMEILPRPDLLIMDCALLDADFPNHVNFAQALELVRRIQPRKTILTQIGVSWPPYHEARRIAKKAKPAVTLAYDGLKISL